MRLVRPVAVLALTLACRPATAATELRPTPDTRPDGAAPVTAPVSPTAGAPSDALNAPLRAPDGGRAIAAGEGRDDVARAVASVFGDSALTDSAAAPSSEAAEPEWDIDVRSYETHERVAHYVSLFTGSARDRFSARLARGTRYDAMIRSKLRAGGLPEDMTFLALIESGYDPDAYSRAAAVGMWQFMSSTARDVGLRVDWWIDERRDPARSTDAAIRFLRDLQQQFGGSLYLAAAAYNGGPGRVSRGLMHIIDARFLPNPHPMRTTH